VDGLKILHSDADVSPCLMTTVDVRHLMMIEILCRRALECERCRADSVLATSWRGGVTFRRHCCIIVCLHMWMINLLIFLYVLYYLDF